MRFGPLFQSAADALREAADDGLTESELGAAVGLRYPMPLIREMSRCGYMVGEDHGRLILVHEPFGEGSRSRQTRDTSGSSSESIPLHPRGIEPTNPTDPGGLALFNLKPEDAIYD